MMRPAFRDELVRQLVGSSKHFYKCMHCKMRFSGEMEHKDCPNCYKDECLEDDPEQAKEHYISLIDQAQVSTGPCCELLQSIQEALNSGDGSYKP